MAADRREPEEEGWDALAQAWQQIVPPRLEQAPAELRRRVLRADLRFRLLALAEYLCYAALIVLVIFYLRERKGTAAFLWGFMMMCFVAWGLDFAVRIRQGLWRAADSSTAAWLDLLAERCARRRRYARVSWFMVLTMIGAMLLMVGAWAIWLPRDFARVVDNAFTFGGVLTATVLLQYLWWKGYLRQVEVEEREIAALRGAPDDPG
jgi:hypothetical protein